MSDFHSDGGIRLPVGGPLVDKSSQPDGIPSFLAFRRTLPGIVLCNKHFADRYSMKLSKAFISVLPSLFPIAVFLVLWQVCSLVLGGDRLPGIRDSASAFISSINESQIIESQGGGDGGYLPHVLATVYNSSLGLIAGLTAGGILALIIFQNELVRDLLDPVLELFRVLPPLIVVPFILVLFPATGKTPILVAALYSAYSICVYTLNALQNVERNYLLIADLSGSNRFQKAIKVQVPAVMPELIGALRITSPLTLGIVIVAEYLGAPFGIGRVLKFAISYSRIDLILVGIVWVVIISIMIDCLIVITFNYLLRWSLRTR